jgi:hypothetical protein
MAAKDIRNWIGAYVLFFSAFLGGYLFLAPISILPLENSDRTSSFEIILPFLLAQVATVYRFYTDPNVNHRRAISAMPVWAVNPIVDDQGIASPLAWT